MIGTSYYIKRKDKKHFYLSRTASCWDKVTIAVNMKMCKTLKRAKAWERKEAGRIFGIIGSKQDKDFKIIKKSEIKYYSRRSDGDLIRVTKTRFPEISKDAVEAFKNHDWHYSVYIDGRIDNSSYIITSKRQPEWKDANKHVAEYYSAEDRKRLKIKLTRRDGKKVNL